MNLQEEIDFKKKIEVRFEIKELRSRTQNIGTNCGSCYYWMTSDCEREKGHKVSCRERVCENFKYG